MRPNQENRERPAPASAHRPGRRRRASRRARRPLRWPRWSARRRSARRVWPKTLATAARRTRRQRCAAARRRFSFPEMESAALESNYRLKPAGRRRRGWIGPARPLDYSAGRTNGSNGAAPGPEGRHRRAARRQPGASTGPRPAPGAADRRASTPARGDGSNRRSVERRGRDRSAAARPGMRRTARPDRHRNRRDSHNRRSRVP